MRPEPAKEAYGTLSSTDDRDIFLGPYVTQLGLDIHNHKIVLLFQGSDIGRVLLQLVQEFVCQSPVDGRRGRLCLEPALLPFEYKPNAFGVMVGIAHSSNEGNGFDTSIEDSVCDPNNGEDLYACQPLFPPGGISMWAAAKADDSLCGPAPSELSSQRSNH
ncbi:uncharacterized protein Z518_03098 [Rhinocladiella mackenziei CBS 650.93]|uniref:Uncharacterized protein n=1 Tax=Rhinocladiella mackenziei CBS 650.93 TaxID=1442369 RepID=A0A0D2G1R9_9EURO|nr:uncharacterized protein Z518_03098 [Rhinocladiella mackenziei CBS 650.93]KIX08442.1 hypothetical protein Z518_03098 [Rhinocladiella mackenziei CBS 650.93]